MIYVGIVVVYVVLAILATRSAYKQCVREEAEKRLNNPYHGHKDEDDWWVGIGAASTILFFVLLALVQFYRYNIDEQYVLSEWHVEHTIRFATDNPNPEIRNLLRTYLADKKLTNKEWYALRKFEKESKLDNFIYGEN